MKPTPHPMACKEKSKPDSGSFHTVCHEQIENMFTVEQRRRNPNKCLQMSNVTIIPETLLWAQHLYKLVLAADICNTRNNSPEGEAVD